MPIKNYTTKVPADRSIQEIQATMVAHGAAGFNMLYEKGTGRIESLQFLLDLEGRHITFRLPVDWRSFQRVLEAQRVSRYEDKDFCYRVAWRVIRDWIMAQMALYETQMVTIPQIFLPYATDSTGQTLFQKIATSPQILLGQ